MIDIHCHILPGIDDGPKDIRESVAMARIAAEDGIKKIVATPHLKTDIYPPTEITDRVVQLNERVAKEGIDIEILPGADVSVLLDPSLLKAYCINKTDYILVEFPHTHLPSNSLDLLFNFSVNGFVPIITHPERNISIMQNPELLFQLLDANALVQITASSIAGGFGPEIQECSLYLLKKGVVDIIATDAHSSEWRRPNLTKGLDVAERIIGKEKALQLVTINPGAVIAGEPIDE